MTDSVSGASAVAPLRFARKIAVAVIGATVLAVGIALIILPGPAVVAIPLGLAILATEFLWAHRMLRRLRDGANGALRRATPEKGQAWLSNCSPSPTSTLTY